ncbi:sugar transferase [bacterium]|nr:sugar transferase [bacterium]MBU1066173.1 sugar transferase [bacterium]MBU1634075.1 sugar transferase [bacterium]MBU1874508.1 sugar transferase [bacterium]
MGKNKSLFALQIKYFFDKVLALIGLIITVPLFLIVGLILKFQKEDVFYRQRRVGFRGNEFYCFKFTTMPKGSEKFGYITTTNDSRPFRFGKFLRKTKLNEIPQLINVLFGSMSLVGPRPLMHEQIAATLPEPEIEQYYLMRPGITGAGSLFYHHEDHLLASVSEPFKYDHEVIMPHKQKLEKSYAENWSLVLDLRILILTFLVVLRRDLDISEDIIFKHPDTSLG